MQFCSEFSNLELSLPTLFSFFKTALDILGSGVFIEMFNHLVSFYTTKKASWDFGGDFFEFLKESTKCCHI